MANLAAPPFPDVDAYLSRENIIDRRTSRVQPESELAKLVPGPRQERNYFWFRKTFRKAIAYPSGGSHTSPTVSRRKLALIAKQS
jgi:hypothetical protein